MKNIKELNNSKVFECNKIKCSTQLFLKRNTGIKNNIPKDSLTLICVLKDEMYYLREKQFIQHYIEQGVDNFIFVVNNSTDGSLEYLMNYPSINCIIYETKDSYKDNDYGTLWVNYILDSELKDRWVVTVDSDEFFYLKSSGLKDVIKDMSMNSQNVAITCLIDLYKENDKTYYDNIKHLKYTNTDVLQTHTSIRGGFRERINGLNGICLTKRSLFKYDFYNKYFLSVGYHYLINKSKYGIENWYKNNYHNLSYKKDIIPLFHLKYIEPNLISKAKKRIENNQEWNNNEEYKLYLANKVESVYSSNCSILFNENNKYPTLNTL